LAEADVGFPSQGEIEGIGIEGKMFMQIDVSQAWGDPSKNESEMTGSVPYDLSRRSVNSWNGTCIAAKTPTRNAEDDDFTYAIALLMCFNNIVRA
jgi:hypothetical protein